MFFVSSYFSITLPPTIVAIVISYFIHSISKTKRNSSIPPGPISIPIFGNWLQVGNDLNHRFLASLSQTYGSICLLKLGSKNLTVVSSPELANQVLHTQGVEFGSCPRNVVFDIFTGNGQDMVFTTYGEHWRKMRRIMTLQKLPYLQATVKETLRLHTPIPLLVPHMNLEEAKLGGYTVPRESKVVVNAWWLANNPEWWKGPEEFRPERFLEEECLTDVAVGGGKVDFRYLPFGMGRRSCPGIILALPILGLIIAKLVTNFEMKAPQGIGKIDLKEKGGQFSLHLANHSTVVFDPIITRA